MKIIVVGTGFVGLTHAAICAEYGHEVYGYDIDTRRIAAYNTGQREAIERYVNEPGLYEAIHETLNQYLFFTTNVYDIIEEVDAIFLCTATPPNRDGSTNLTYYQNAVHTLGDALANRKNKKRVVIVNKSTVPIGTARVAEAILNEHKVENFGVASNPEFLPEGNAVELSRRPDRVVVGADTEADFEILRRVYPQFTNHVRIRYIEASPETAEAIKYVANTLLLTYISFWNGVGARLGETFPGVNMEALKLGVTADNRISTWGSYVSNGAGGSCFGKDIQSLIYQLKRQNHNTDLLQAVYRTNEYQKDYLIERAEHEAGFNFNQKTVTLLGLSFKKHTNDMRDSSALTVVKTLLGRGVAHIRAYDPVANEEAQRYLNPQENHLYERITYHESARTAIEGSDALFISTDWEEFRGLGTLVKQTVKPPYLVIDGRRMISDYRELVEAGYGHIAVGGTYLEPKVDDLAFAEALNGALP